MHPLSARPRICSRGRKDLPTVGMRFLARTHAGRLGGDRAGSEQDLATAAKLCVPVPWLATGQGTLGEIWR